MGKHRITRFSFSEKVLLQELCFFDVILYKESQAYIISRYWLKRAFCLSVIFEDRQGKKSVKHLRVQKNTCFKRIACGIFNRKPLQSSFLNIYC